MIVPPQLSHKQKEEAVRDFYASVRTNVLLAWVLSNVRDRTFGRRAEGS